MNIDCNLVLVLGTIIKTLNQFDFKEHMPIYIQLKKKPLNKYLVLLFILFYSKARYRQFSDIRKIRKERLA